ncbi:MAG: ribonuclease E/G [Lachnospiraceae bacterium]|nr:ribonuclease E/G [Lachnospiraceae bacterium]
MSKTIVITDVNIKENNERLCLACLENDRLSDLEFDTKTSVGNIYVGKIADIKDSLNGMFVNVASDRKVYLPYREIKSPIVVNKYSKGSELKSGDEILVEITQDAIKTKEPKASTNLSFKGKGFVLTTHRHEITASSKLGKETADLYKEYAREVYDRLLPELNHGFGIIIRTNAETYVESEFKASLEEVLSQADNLLGNAIHNKVYSRIKEADPWYIDFLTKYKDSDVDKIVTDKDDIFERISEAQTLLSSALIAKLEKYCDTSLKLTALYGLNSKVNELFEKKVYLKSGAYIIIEQTETMTLIDVNSGKNDKNRKEDYFFKINCDAAAEIANQIRLRNISGMILVDFINLDSEKYEAELLKHMRRLLKTDPVRADALDITKLGLMEITRKKIKKPISELF